AKAGQVSDGRLGEFERMYKKLGNPIVEQCVSLIRLLSGDEKIAEQSPADEEITPEMIRSALLDIFENEIGDLRELHPKYARKERLAHETGMAINALPDEGELLLLMRYESALQNKLFKAMHELQRIQAFRLGARVPLPIAVDVNSEESGGIGIN
ncbi:MAG: hypothetical protein O7B79_13190, partial [SAR324 cluster bacterium]|nr:hypothetical protein [SAR324 cluster bacterium]